MAGDAVRQRPVCLLSAGPRPGPPPRDLSGGGRARSNAPNVILTDPFVIPGGCHSRGFAPLAAAAGSPVAAGCRDGPRSAAQGGGGALRAAAGEHVPPSRQAQSCPEAQGAWRSWLDAGDEWLSPECHPWRSAGCEKCSPPHPRTGHTLVTLGQSRPL